MFSCLLLVAFSFSASDGRGLAPVLATVAVAAWTVRPFSVQILRLLWMLRWLLLFTLLMHLFFSSGRTLWGLSWLSFDGLVLGVFVCMQVSLAVAVSTLLGMTTKTMDLALAFGWMVRPLRVLGFRTTEWQKIMLQALDFIPFVHAEIRASKNAGEKVSEDINSETRQGWLHVWGKKLHHLIFRLVERGDEIACRLATEEATNTDQQRLPVFMPMALLDQLFVLTLCLVSLVYWLAG